MVGNDIIDLNATRINSRWKEQRFLDKLFTTEEQAFIFEDDYGQFQNIWHLWSMKESAYKIVARNFNAALFNPKAFLCKPDFGIYGTVVFENQHISTSTIINPKFIYTIAHLDNIENINSQLFEQNLTQIQQREVLHKEAIREFANSKFIPLGSISIQKNMIGVPQFYIEDKPQMTYLSFTQHGNYGGFAIMN